MKIDFGADHYDHLVTKLYGDKIASAKTQRYQTTVAPSGAEVITIEGKAHAVLFLNAAQKTYYLGFVELVNDPAVATKLILATKARLANSGYNLFCPVDKTIWHSYRFKVSGSRTLPLEEPQMAYYPTLLRPFFRKHEMFASFSAPLGARKKAVNCPIKIRQLNSAKTTQELEGIFKLVTDVFTSDDHPAPMQNEFMAFHQELLPILNPKYVWLAEDKGKIVGLCFSFVSNNELFFKTMAVHPDYRRLSVGQALYNSAVSLAEKEGCQQEYYLFVKSGRLINRLMPKSVKKVAEYILFNKLK